MRKLHFLFLMIAFMVPFGAFAQHHKHHHDYGYLSLSGAGWYINIGNPPPFQGLQQPYYYQPPPLIYSVPPQAPKQLFRVCGPIYFVQTPFGQSQQQNCWMEWR